MFSGECLSTKKDLKIWSRVDPRGVLLQPRDTFQNKGSLVYKQLPADCGESWWHSHPLLPMLLTGRVTLSKAIAFLNGNFLICLGLPSKRSQEAWKVHTRHLGQGLAFTKHWINRSLLRFSLLWLCFLKRCVPCCDRDRGPAYNDVRPYTIPSDRPRFWFIALFLSNIS